MMSGDDTEKTQDYQNQCSLHDHVFELSAYTSIILACGVGGGIRKFGFKDTCLA